MLKNLCQCWCQAVIKSVWCDRSAIYAASVIGESFASGVTDVSVAASLKKFSASEDNMSSTVTVS